MANNQARFAIPEQDWGVSVYLLIHCIIWHAKMFTLVSKIHVVSDLCSAACPNPSASVLAWLTVTVHRESTRSLYYDCFNIPMFADNRPAKHRSYA